MEESIFTYPVTVILLVEKFRGSQPCAEDDVEGGVLGALKETLDGMPSLGVIYDGPLVLGWGEAEVVDDGADGAGQGRAEPGVSVCVSVILLGGRGTKRKAKRGAHTT